MLPNRRRPSGSYLESLGHILSIPRSPTMLAMALSVIDRNPEQVLEYLNKKGYSKTEATLRKESHAIDGGGRDKNRIDDLGGEKYPVAFGKSACTDHKG